MENEKIPVVFTQAEDGSGSSAEKEKSQEEAMEFVNRHRDFFEHYARGKIKFEPAAEGMDTFGFDLKTNTIYISPRFYRDLGFSEEKTSFATLHEAEHFLEKMGMLSEDGGEKKFGGYLKRIQESEAYGLMDNCVADVRENGAVVQKTNQSFRDIEIDCYKKDLFKETDFTKEPKHIQFCYALLREARVPGEECQVAPDVRKKLD